MTASGPGHEESVVPFESLGGDLGLPSVGPWGDVWDSTLEMIREAGYRPTELLPSGASAEVVKAIEKETERRVAVKVLRDPGSSVYLTQFKQEAHMLSAQVLPQSVVRYYQKLEREGAQPALVLEFIEGSSLIDADQKGQGLDPNGTAALSRRLGLLEQLCSEVESLHDCGIAWGDCSSNNVLVDEKGRVRLLDLAQASRLGDGPRGPHSRTLQVMGTRGYSLDPEAPGQRASRLSDVHMATAAGYRLLVGHYFNESEPNQTREKASRSDYLRELRAAGVPASVAAKISAGLQPLGPSATGAERPGPRAIDVADAIRGWRIRVASQCTRRRQRLLLLAVALPLTALATFGWMRYLGVAREAQARGIAVRAVQLEARPNLGHRALVGAVENVDKLHARWETLVARGALGEAEAVAEDVIAAQQVVLDRSYGIEAQEPLRETLGEVLVRTPWRRGIPALDAALVEAERRHQSVIGKIDAGETEAAWPELRGLQRDLAKLAALNATAARAIGAREEFERLRDGAATRIQGLPDWKPIAARGEGAGVLLNRDTLDEGVLREATREYQQGYLALETFLRSKERTDERTQRLASDLMRVERLDALVRTLEKDLQGAEASELEARKELATVTAQCDEIAEDRDLWEDQVTKVQERAKGLETAKEASERMRRKAEGERDQLSKQVEEKNERVAELRREIAGLRSKLEVAGARPALSTEEVPGTVATPALPAKGGSPSPFKNHLGQHMIGIEAGRFMMPNLRLLPGSPEWRDSREFEVAISSPFWMSSTEVTQSQWEAMMESKPWMPGHLRRVSIGADSAAAHMDWNSAVQFCEALTLLEKDSGALPEGYVYRLPTSAEWEYACRAGTSTDFFFGDDPMDLQRYAVCQLTELGKETNRVATKQPNPWGFFDMLGNVEEWCLDAGQANQHGTTLSEPKDLGHEDPLCTQGDERVTRGGSWHPEGRHARYWEYGGAVPPETEDQCIGLRPVLARKIATR